MVSLLIQKADTQKACTSSAKLAQLQSRFTIPGVLQVAVQCVYGYYVQPTAAVNAAFVAAFDALFYNYASLTCSDIGENLMIIYTYVLNNKTPNNVSYIAIAAYAAGVSSASQQA